MFRFKIGKYIPKLDFVAFFWIVAVCSMLFTVNSCTSYQSKWGGGHITEIIGIENFKLNEKGVWIGSNNPRVAVNFNNQKHVFRIFRDDSNIVIYTKDKNYVSKIIGDGCNNRSRDSVSNRFAHTSKVYEVVDKRKNETKYWVCSSKYGSCLRYHPVSVE